jgi:hypothetical protein
MQRQFLHTHRPFRATVMDRTGKPVLWVSTNSNTVQPFIPIPLPPSADTIPPPCQIRRPFSIINSRIMVYTGEGDGADTQLVGESQQ